MMAYSIKYTLKSSLLLNPAFYRTVSFLVFVVVNAGIQGAGNTGQGFDGICGFKVANQQSLARMILELFTCLICVYCMYKFKQKIPKNSYFQNQAVFGYYYYYMGIFAFSQFLQSMA